MRREFGFCTGSGYYHVTGPYLGGGIGAACPGDRPSDRERRDGRPKARPRSRECTSSIGGQATCFDFGDGSYIVSDSHADGEGELGFCTDSGYYYVSAPSARGRRRREVPGRSRRLGRDGPPEEEGAHGGDDQREDRQADADHADDREHEADDADQPGDAAHDSQRVGPLLTRAAGCVAACAVPDRSQAASYPATLASWTREDSRTGSRSPPACGANRSMSRCPSSPPGDPEAQVNEFEIRLVDALCGQATPETAKGIAEKTWDLVHDRPDDDVVKKHVTEWHERLAKMSTPGVP